MADADLRQALLDLLERLEAVGADHEELCDSDVREQMFEAVYRGFLKPEPGYELPQEFGLFDASANAAVRVALSDYIRIAAARATVVGISKPADRLAAFQDGDVMTRSENQYPDDFFGWAKSI